MVCIFNNNKNWIAVNSDMHRFVYILGLLLSSSIVTHARHTVLISHTGAKTYLPSSPEPEVCMTPTCVIAAADILTTMDESLDPCDDFFSFACGGWIKRQEVSDDQPMITMYKQTQNSLDLKLKEILESKNQISDPPFVRLIKDFYNTCADLDTIEKQGSDQLKKILRHLGGWPVVEGSQWDESQFDWIETLISFRKLGYNYKILLNLYVHTDMENSPIKMLQLKDPYFTSVLTSANLSLGLDDDGIAAFYRKMVKAAKLLGAEESTAEKEMLEALRFEMALINITKSNNDQEISPSSLAIRLFGGRGRRVNRKNTFAKLQNELPQVPWLKIVNGLLLSNEVKENETFIDGKHEFLVKFADLITSTDKRAIANYMLWQAVLQSAKYLSKEWEEITEEDEPSKEKLPRWKQCLKELEENMEIGISSYYVRNYFTGEDKDEAIIMMKYILKEFLKILENNDWMDEKTRKKAEDKANAIKSYIGYPQELLNDTFMMKTYENLTITTDSYLEKVLAIHKWGTDKYLLTLKDMSDVMEGSMKYNSLIEVNAYYDPVENSIGIPAGLLHEAFFDKDRPNYLNYGITGYTIGHEITHGFDNDGREYDKDGKHVNWWDKESDKHFRKKAKCMVDQYNNYTTYIGMKVNGENTLGENIADNGGMKEAYLAYHTWIKDHGTEPLLPGLNYNQNQLFWLGAAYSECVKYKPEKLKEMLLTDNHSPGKFRVIGSMSNLPEFSKDFKCSPDAPMNRKYKCQVW